VREFRTREKALTFELLRVRKRVVMVLEKEGEVEVVVG
jgi:hypothetical protein